MLSCNLETNTRGASPRKALRVILATAIAMIGATTAQAATIFTGDQTTVLVTSFFALTDAGFTVAPLGSAVVGDDVAKDVILDVPRVLAAFPITGGGINTMTGDVIVEHDGSGLELSTDTPASVALENFEILLDATASGNVLGTLFGDVTINGGDPIVGADIFTLTGCGLGLEPACIDSDASTILNGVRLGLTSTAAGVLNDTFDVDVFAEGDQVGIARVDVRVVPEPGTLLLTSLGLVGLAYAGRSRREA